MNSDRACIHHEHIYDEDGNDTYTGDILGVVCDTCNQMDEQNARSGVKPTEWGKSCEAFRKRVKKTPLLRRKDPAALT